MTFGLPTLLCAGLLLAPPATAPSGSATSPSVAAGDLEAAVAMLLGANADERDAARQEILAAGEAALPALQAARAAAREPDAQVRLDTLLVQVKERVDVGATKVTLEFSDAPLDVVIESLGKQAKAQLSGGDLASELGGADTMPRLTLDLRDVTFWRAMMEIQTAANVIFMPQPDGWRVARNFGRPNMLRGTESGAFLVQPTMASYQRRVSYAANMGDGGENFSLMFQALAEPKIRLAAGVGSVSFERAVDSNGNDLLAAQRSMPVTVGNGQSPIVCNLPLKYPKNPGTTITEIRGSLKISIARRTDQVASEDLLADGKVEATIQGIKMRVVGAVDESVPGGVAINVTLDSNGDLAAVQRLQQNFQQLVQITDARGRRLQLANTNPVRTDARGTEFRYSYISTQPARSSGPYKLRIDVPSGYREVEVPFVMRDLKMP